MQKNINSICGSKFSAPQHIEVLLFTLLKEAYPTLPSSPLLVNNTIQHMPNEFNYLGVTFSSDTSWTSHINAICLNPNLGVCKLYLGPLPKKKH